MAYFNRWLTFCVSCLVMTCGGLGYLFAVFAPALKSRFEFNETEMNTVASTFNIGGYLAVLSGAVYDALSGRNRLGPRLVLLVGAALLSIGYAGLYACMTGYITPTLPKVLVVALIAGNAGTWIDTSGLVTNVRNFPADRGTVVGILKSFLGLSASIYSSIYVAVFAPDVLSFIGFLAVVPPAVVLLGSIFINHVPQELHVDDPSSHSGGVYALPPASGRGVDAYIAPPDMQHQPQVQPEHTVVTVPPQPQPVLRTPDADPQARWLQGHMQGVVPVHRPHRRGQLSRHTRFVCIYTLVGLVAMYQMSSTIYESQHELDRWNLQLVAGGVVLLLLLLLLVPLESGECTHASRHNRGWHRGRHHSSALRASEKGSSKAEPTTPRQAVSFAAGTSSASAMTAAAASDRSRGSLTPAPIQAHTEIVKSRSDAAPTAPSTSPFSHPVVSATRGLSALIIVPRASSTPQSIRSVTSTAAPAFGTPLAGSSGHSSFCTAVSADLEQPLLGRQSQRLEDDEGQQELGPTAHEVSSEDDESSTSEDEEVAAEEEAEARTQPAMDASTWQAMCSPIYWLIFLQFGVALGTGLTYLNNLSSIVLALGGAAGGQVVLVSLFSIANACGRLLLGHLSEHYLHKAGTPRTLPLLVMAVCSLLLACMCYYSRDFKALYPLSLLAGLSFGGHWSLVPAITSDVFGLRHFGANYTSLQLAPALGGYLLSTVLASYVYQAAAERHGEGLYCLGADCYSQTWQVLIGLNVLSVLSTFALSRLAAPLYGRVRAASLRRQAL